MLRLVRSALLLAFALSACKHSGGDRSAVLADVEQVCDEVKLLRAPPQGVSAIELFKACKCYKQFYNCGLAAELPYNQEQCGTLLYQCTKLNVAADCGDTIDDFNSQAFPGNFDMCFRA